MNQRLERILIIIGALVVIGLAIGLPFLSNPSEELLLKFALSQLAFSAVAFLIVFIALYFNIVQLRKALAKPQLELLFSEDNSNLGEGKTKKTITIQKDVSIKEYLYLWANNSGNAVAKSFQIEFEIGDDLGPSASTSTTISQTKSPSGNSRIFSFYNDGDNVFFVNRPKYIGTVILKVLHSEYKKLKKEYKIPYRVFGDWAETQTGELTILCDKK